MLKTNNKTRLEVCNSVVLQDYQELEKKGKGKHFTSRFIEAGIAEYKGTFGRVLITKETLDKFINTMVGVPVIIKHKDITDKNIKDERVGTVSEVWYNADDGWYYCSGIIFDAQAIDLIQNQNWSVSCTYDFESDFKKGTYHGLDYDMQFTGGEFLHLALVPNPRYERANIVMNSKDEALFTVYNDSDQDLSDTSKDRWITIHPNGEESKGRPLLIKAGKTVEEAIKEKFHEWAGMSSRQQKLFDVKEYSKSKEEIKKDREEQKKADKLHEKITDIEDILKYDITDKQTREILEKDLKNLKESKPKEHKEEQLISKPEDLKQVAEKKGVEKRDVKPEDIGLEANKETKALETKTDLNAAQERYKDVLSKYNEANRKRWQSGISPAEYHKAWADAEKYKKELTAARREYAESIMSNFEAVEDNPYEQRLEDKKMRYEEMAAKTDAESKRMAQVSRDMVSAIPMGQPILVGHHSEMRDRRYRQRAWDKMDKAYQLSKKADYYERKAGSAGTAGISADDANAIAKLAQKYKSGVDSAEKRRIIDRVIDLHKRATSTAPATETTEHGFKIERNKDINRLQLKFDSIPDANTRAILKSNGFRWSPREKAWQRQLNGNSEYSLKQVMEKMKAENSLLKGLDEIIETHEVTEKDIPLLEKINNILFQF